MRRVWSEEVDSILGVGRSLESVGVRNWALERDAALSALERLSDLGVGVLGGDVYVDDGGRFSSNYDNWHCSKELGEPDADFVFRSVCKAKNYIVRYQLGGALFAFVPDTATSAEDSVSGYD